MLLSDFTVVPSKETVAKGRVTGAGSYDYEIHGPFGQGYNIRISGSGGAAQLSYNWRDGPGAQVQSAGETFSMTETTMSGGRKSDTILQLSGGKLESAIRDGVLLSLFVIHHHYARRTGPFTRPGTTNASGA
jgi:hypothetical protein